MNAEALESPRFEDGQPVPEADAVEQHTPLVPDEDDEPAPVPMEAGPLADEGDWREQNMTVLLDEDEYRDESGPEE